MGKFYKDSVTYLWANVISVGVGFVTLPIYTRFLTPSDFGIVVLFVMFGNICSGLLSFGLHNATYRYYFQYQDTMTEFRILNSTNLCLNIIVFSVGGIGVFFLADRITTTFFNGQLTASLIKWAFFSGCMQYLITYVMFLLNAQTRSLAFSVVTVSRILLNTVLSSYFIFLQGLTYMARIYATLLTQTVVLIVLMVLTRELFSLRFSVSYMKKSLRFSYPFIPLSFIGLAYSSFDKTMLTKYKGLTSVGYYNFGEKFAGLLKTVMDSVSKVWMPFFMEQAHKNTKEGKDAIVKRYFELAFLFMIGGMVIIYFSEEMIKILTTKEFYPSMYVVPVYVYFYMFGIMGMLSVNQIMYAEKIVSMIPSSIASIILNIILNILLIPRYGAVGAAVATAIAALGADMVLLHFGLRAFPLPRLKLRLVNMFMLSFFFALLSYPLMAVEINFIIKIAVKAVIVVLFIVAGIKLKYVSWEALVLLTKKVFMIKEKLA